MTASVPKLPTRIRAGLNHRQLSLYALQPATVICRVYRGEGWGAKPAQALVVSLVSKNQEARFREGRSQKTDSPPATHITPHPAPSNAGMSSLEIIKLPFK